MYSTSTEIKLYHPQLISNFYSDKYTTYRNMELTGQDIDTIGMLQLILQECKHATKHGVNYMAYTVTNFH